MELLFAGRGPDVQPRRKPAQRCRWQSAWPNPI